VDTAERDQLLGDLVIGVVPGDPLPTGPSAALGTTQSIGVFMNPLARECLGADIASASRVVGITRDVEYTACLRIDLDTQATTGLTNWT